MSGREEEDDSTFVFPSVHKFNGKTKEFMARMNSESTIKAYEKLLKKLDCKPSEFSSKLRDRVWKGKSPHDILAEAEKD